MLSSPQVVLLFGAVRSLYLVRLSLIRETCIPHTWYLLTRAPPKHLELCIFVASLSTGLSSQKRPTSHANPKPNVFSMLHSQQTPIHNRSIITPLFFLLRRSNPMNDVALLECCHQGTDGRNACVLKPSWEIAHGLFSTATVRSTYKSSHARRDGAPLTTYPDRHCESTKIVVSNRVRRLSSEDLHNAIPCSRQLPCWPPAKASKPSAGRPSIY